MNTAISVIELSSIARGVFVSDAMVKKAPVDIIVSKTISSGKYIILISGDIASVEEAKNIGVQMADECLVDSLFIPHLHPQILPALKKVYPNVTLSSIAIVETTSVASAILSLDFSLKTADVSVKDLVLGRGIGGKGYFILTGELSEIEAAVSAAREILEEKKKLLQIEIIPSPHGEFVLPGEEQPKSQRPEVSK